MSKPLPRKLDFVCSLVEPPTNRAGVAALALGFGALLALVGSYFMDEDIWASGALRFSAIILAAFAVLFFSQASAKFDARAKVQMEVGLDGLRLPTQTISFRNLRTVQLDSDASSYATLHLLLDDGNSLKLSMLNAEPVARLIRERHELFKRLTAPRARPRADGYRGVRIAEESESIEEGIRQEEWSDEDLEAVLAVALVIPAAER